MTTMNHRAWWAVNDKICRCNFSHYAAMLDDLPDDENPHGDGCPFADPPEGC